MREVKQKPGVLQSLFIPIFIGGALGWIAPYLLLNAPLSGDRFLDGVVGLVVCGLIGGIVGAMIKRR